MRRVIRLKAVKDGTIVKIVASVNQPSYRLRVDQQRYNEGMADELYDALRHQGFFSQQIRFEK